MPKEACRPIPPKPAAIRFRFVTDTRTYRQITDKGPQLAPHADNKKQVLR